MICFGKMDFFWLQKLEDQTGTNPGCTAIAAVQGQSLCRSDLRYQSSYLIKQNGLLSLGTLVTSRLQLLQELKMFVIQIGGTCRVGQTPPHSAVMTLVAG